MGRRHEFWGTGSGGRGSGDHVSDVAVYRLVLPKKVALAVILLVQKGEGLGV